jgi:hypothetical protein
MKSYLRPLAVFLTVVAIGAFAWIFSLPSKAECAASGRVVDPTERHCDTPGGGFQQLEEHALFHASQVLLYAAVLLAGGLAVRFYVRRRSRRAPPAA